MLACAYEAPSLTGAGERLNESNSTSEFLGNQLSMLSPASLHNTGVFMQSHPFQPPFRRSTRKRIRRWT